MKLQFVLAALMLAPAAFADKDKALKNYDKFSRRLKPGTVLEMKSSGEDYELKVSPQGIKPNKRSLTVSEKTIILQVNEGQIYAYSEQRDGSGEVDAKIIVSSGIYGFVPEIFSSDKTEFDNGKSLTLFEDQGYKQIENATIEEDLKINIEIDVKKICSMKMKTEVSKATFVHKGERVSLEPVSNLIVYTCGPQLNEEELAELDLSSIEVCKEQGDEELSCEDPQDMTRLVKKVEEEETDE